MEHDERRPIDLMTLATWPLAMAEEAARLPESLRNVRLLMAEQVRLMRNLNDATEMVLRLGRRLEEADLGTVVARVEGMAEGMEQSMRLLRGGPLSDPERMERMEKAVEDMRERVVGIMGSGARQAMRAYESWRTRPEEREADGV